MFERYTEKARRTIFFAVMKPANSKRRAKRISESREKLKPEAVGTPTPSTESSPGRATSGLRLVEISNTKWMLNYPLPAAVPRIGESILVHHPDGAERMFRVDDVIWEFRKEAGVSQLESGEAAGPSLAKRG